MKLKTIIIGLVLTLNSLSHAANKGWLENFEAAKKKALAEKKDILVDFTGSDWCHWCIKLSEEVFSHDEFSQGVADKFVLLELDFPRDKSGQSEEIQKQNAELQERFAIQGFPTVLLLDAQGLPFAQTGYAEGGPAAYLKMLDEMRQMRIQRDEKLTISEKQEGLDKAKSLVEALDFIPSQLHGSFYSDIVTQITTLDPKDETGYGIIAHFQTLEKDYVSAMQAGNSDEAVKLVLAFIEEKKPQGEDHQGVLAMLVDPLMSTKQFDKAGKVLEDIIAIDPETEIGKQASDFKPQLAQIKTKAEASKAPTEPKK